MKNNKQNKGRDATPSRPPLDRPQTGRDATPSRPPLDAQAKRELTATIAAMRGTETTALLRAIIRTSNDLERAEVLVENLAAKLQCQVRELARQSAAPLVPSCLGGEPTPRR